MTVIVSMSAVWTKLLATLCLFCTGLSIREKTGVIWVDVGGTITIQCRPSQPGQENLTLKRGLNEEVVMFVEREKHVISPNFTNRVQSNGIFPNVDILIKNLSSEDTGPYWCVYKMLDKSQIKEEKGSGSVLLAVRDASQMCDPSKDNLVLVSVMICAALLFVIIVGILIWIIFKAKTLSITKRKKRTTNNDVYEEMRGTIRR